MESGSHAESTNATNCPNGHDLPPGAAFCPECGASAQAIEADVAPRESGESKCGNGHSVPEGISFCVICGEEIADEPAQSHLTVAPGAPNRRIAIVVGAILALALMAALIWWAQGRGESEGDRDAPNAADGRAATYSYLVDECLDQYAWAFDTLLEDDGGYGDYDVRMEFGVNDGRLDVTRTFFHTYLTRRDAVGHDRALTEISELLKDYCSAVGSGLEVDGTPVTDVLGLNSSD
ncbi:MAG: zinc ribbon domain-containing protein [Scrofimicrobium sp.]